MIAKLTGAAFTVALATAQTAPSDANQRPAPQSSGRCSVPLLSFRVPDNHGYKLNVIPVPPAFNAQHAGKFLLKTPARPCDDVQENQKTAAVSDPIRPGWPSAPRSNPLTDRNYFRKLEIKP